MILVLSLCRRQSTIRVRLRSVTKPATPPVTIPSMGTSTRDCRNSGGEHLFANLDRCILIHTVPPVFPQFFDRVKSCEIRNLLHIFAMLHIFYSVA